MCQSTAQIDSISHCVALNDYMPHCIEFYNSVDSQTNLHTFLDEGDDTFVSFISN